MARERKHDLTRACSELRGILAREVSERWTHARFLEVYGAFCRSERHARLQRSTRAWLAGMVDGAHTTVHAVCHTEWFIDGEWRDRKWMYAQPEGSVWCRAGMSRTVWPTGEER